MLAAGQHRLSGHHFQSTGSKNWWKNQVSNPQQQQELPWIYWYLLISIGKSWHIQHIQTKNRESQAVARSKSTEKTTGLSLASLASLTSFSFEASSFAFAFLLQIFFVRSKTCSTNCRSKRQTNHHGDILWGHDANIQATIWWVCGIDVFALSKLICFLVSGPGSKTHWFAGQLQTVRSENRTFCNKTWFWYWLLIDYLIISVPMSVGIQPDPRVSCGNGV